MSAYISPSVIEIVDSTYANPYTIAVGQTAQGVISDSGDYDYFRVSVTAGQTYAFALVGTGNNSLNDPYLSILNSSGSVVAFNDDVVSGSTRWSELTYTPITTGILTIKVQSFPGGAGGQYGLSISAGTRFNFDYAMGAGALHQASDGVWGSGSGQSATVSYGFRETHASYASSHAINTFTQLSASQINAVRTILGLWSDICNISFQEINPGGFSDNATILFGNYRGSANDAAGAFAYMPGSDLASPRGNVSSSSLDGDVWLNTNSISTANIQQGTYGFMAIMHEIGHAIGLDHPGPYNASSGTSITYSNSAYFVQDSGQYTVMSYFDGSNTGQYPGFVYAVDSPMMFDILALQNIYGANMNTRTSNTIYGFGCNAGSTYDFTINTSPQICIWDAGGMDTLNCSGFSQNQNINLDAGSFSNIGAQTSNISIALNTIIENAVGGSGNDVIYGNSVSNEIQGGTGNDTLAGGSGNDILYGGTGNDTFDWDVLYRAGNDTFYGGTGNDVYVIDSASGDVVVEYANEGTDTIWAEVTYSLATFSNVENLSLFGSNNINATGNSLNNILTGNSGNNAINGGTGIDTAVFSGTAASHTITVGSNTTTVVDRTSSRDGADTLTSIERLQFSDTNIALDVQGGQNAGMAYRMYRAALNRAPDLAGLGAWTYVLDNGADVYNDLAHGFVASAEFQARYGTLSTTNFVTQLYQNVLGRGPDAAGLAAWVGAIDQRGASREVVLYGFSESAENISYSLGLIGQGMAYTAYT